MGVALSFAFVVVSTDVGRSLLLPRLLRAVDEALAGRIDLDGFYLLSQGGVELVGLRVIDPDGDVVLRVDRARAYVDLGRLRSKVLGVRVELAGPAAVLEREEDGSLSIAHAFAPTHPSVAGEKPTTFDWTVRLTRLTLRGGSVRYVDATERAAFQIDGLTIDARGGLAPGRGRLELSLRGDMVAPERAPLALDVAAGLRGTELRVRQLRAAVGDTALELVGDVDWESRRGRAALVALAVDAAQLRELAPEVPLAGDLDGTLYLESDGRYASAALDLAPRRGGGTARVAAAARLPPGTVAAGGDVHLAALDLSRVLRGAPRTSITLDARGNATGRADLATLVGGVSLSLAPSRLRTGQVGPAELRATARQGTVEVTRLEASLPGGAVRGHGRWRRRGELAGQVTLDASDLAALRRNLEGLLAQPLPALVGSLRVEVDVSGTESAPVARLRATSPRLASPEVAASTLSLAGNLAGPLSSPSLQLDGTIARLVAGRLDARNLKLGARLRGRSGDVSVTGAVPELGREPLALSAGGGLSPDGRVLQLSSLILAWPGDRFELQGPARVDLAGPSVDRFALASGPQRLVLSGGVTGKGRRRALAARAQLEQLDLALLPRALLPPKLGLAGRVGADVTVKGTPAAPEVIGHVELAQGAAMGMDGLSAAADLGYDGQRRRARVDLELRRAAGGELEVRVDLPVLLARAPASSPIAARVSLRAFPVPDALRLAEVIPPAEVGGVLAADVQVGGTVGAPTFEGDATLDDARYGELDALALKLHLEDLGEEARLTAAVDHGAAHGAANGTASGAANGAANGAGRALDLEGSVPLDLAELIRDPGPVARRLADAPLVVKAAASGYDLALLAGRMGVPEDLRGKLTLRADLSGTARAPRGGVTAALTGGAYAGYRDLAGEVTLTARDGATALEGKASLEGDELVQLSSSIALSLERLGDGPAREGAALDVRIDVPRADLRRAGASVPLEVEITAKVRMAGTLVAPRVTADVSGRRLQVSGHPLGELAAKARVEGRSVHGELHLAVATGGTLDGTLDASADPSLPALRRGDIGRAPAQARLVAKDLDLGFLPAVAPGVIRSASGKLAADIAASGPLAHLVPRGTISLAGGRASVAEYGDWRDVGLQASISEDDFRVDEFVARHGGGKLELKASAKGLARKNAPADLTAELRTDSLTISRAGQDLATVNVAGRLTGTVSRQTLDAVLTIPQGRVKLPDRSPRQIQTLDQRDDIVVGSFRKKAKPAAAEEEAGPRPTYRASVHVLIPNRFFVKGDKPVVDVELKADVTASYEEGEVMLTGDVETLRGRVEPFSGRTFEVKRARVHFPGEQYTAGVLEVQALWAVPRTGDSPATKVTVVVGGTIESPEVKLTSEPAMDESQIALLIATGRTELKAGTGGIDPNMQDVGTAALGAVSQQVFKDVLADKLPVDTVAFDASQIRAGKYLTDKIYVGYTRRFNAKAELGENTNEARVEFLISPRWNFEVSYGDANTGAASLIWSKDY